MSEILLKQTNTYLCLNEQDAYALIEEMRAKKMVEDSSVKQKKMTKKKAEHYIVTISERIDTADNHIALDAE